ncbi:hypothetical protein Cgig2_027396 [Carnegiea gigantea]|uniref:Uncharacterized protein n=1 Tax=Carnegiea gigantea TaxID=171969 RepID=A0A9Q1QDH4_9CARY|nr:hypothetical protein Cgig2_027396 [Carnegiea gigantea]
MEKAHQADASISLPKKEESWGSSPRSDYVPQAVAGDSDSNVSLVEDGDVDMYNAKKMESSMRELDERKMVPNEGKGRHKRHRVAGDGVVIRDNPRMRIRTLHEQAIEGKVLKQILHYHKFGILRELAMGICKRKAELSMLDVVLREKLDEITLVTTKGNVQREGTRNGGNVSS